MKKLMIINRQSTGTKLVDQKATQPIANQLERLILKLNQNAAEMIMMKKYDQGQEMLSKAEGALMNLEQNKDLTIKANTLLRNKLLAITYNNLANLYKDDDKSLLISLYQNIIQILKHMGKFDQALKYIQDLCQKLEKTSASKQNSPRQGAAYKNITHYKNLAQLYLQKAQCQERLSFKSDIVIQQLEISLAYAKQSNDHMIISECMNHIHMVKNQQKIQPVHFYKDEVINQSLVDMELIQQREAYKNARQIYRSKRGKGPKQGSLAGNDYLKHGSQSQNPTSRLFSPAQLSEKSSKNGLDENYNENTYLFISQPKPIEFRINSQQRGIRQFNSQQQEVKIFRGNFYLPNVELMETRQPIQDNFHTAKYLSKKKDPKIYSPQVEFNSKLNSVGKDKKNQSYSKRLENFNNNFIKPFQQEAVSIYGEYSNDVDESKRFFNKRSQNRQDGDTTFTYNNGLMEAAKIYTGTNNVQFRIPASLRKIKVKKTAVGSNRTQVIDINESSYIGTPRKNSDSNVINLSPKAKLIGINNSFRITNAKKSPYLSTGEQWSIKRKESLQNSTMKKGLPLKIDESFRIYKGRQSEIIEETARSYISSTCNQPQNKGKVPSPNGSKTHRSFISQEDGIIVEDHVSKIAGAIDKLNSQLMKFQDELKNRQRDPLVQQHLTESSLNEEEPKDEALVSYRSEDYKFQ